ncbi:MAG: LPS export ABC transporter permease LptG [Parvularculaceae bacterium]
MTLVDAVRRTGADHAHAAAGPANGVFTRYVGRQFGLAFVGFLAFVTIILQMLDLLNNSTEISAAEGADWRSVAKYVSLRAPQIISQFTPFAALLAIVMTLSSLNQRSEITIMRAAGMSAHRVLAPLGVACALITTAHFAFHETVVVGASERLAYWEANDYAVGLPPESGTRTDVRVALDDEFVRAESAARRGDRVRLSKVTIYGLDGRELAENVIEASAAIYARGEWRLIDVTRLDARTLERRAAPAQTWATDLDPDILFATALNPDRTNLSELRTQIEQLQRNGADVNAPATTLLSRFSKPLATLVMPLLGAIAGFGVARQGAQLARAVIGAVLGFSYFVIENMMLALGKLGAAPAALGAFFPLALFAIVGVAILLTMEN